MSGKDFPCNKMFENTIYPGNITTTINPKQTTDFPLPPESKRKYWPNKVDMRIRTINTDTIVPDKDDNELKDILNKYKVSFGEQTKPGSEGYIELKPKRDVYMNTDPTSKTGFGQLDSSTDLMKLNVSMRDSGGRRIIYGNLEIPNNFMLETPSKKFEEVPYKKNNMTYYLPGTPTWLYQTSGTQMKHGGSKVSATQKSEGNTIGENTNNFVYEVKDSGDIIDPDLIKWVNQSEQESWRKIMVAFYRSSKGEWKYHNNTNPSVHKNTHLQIEIMDQMCNKETNNWGKGSTQCHGTGPLKYIVSGSDNFKKIVSYINTKNTEYIQKIITLRKQKYEKWGGIGDCGTGTSIKQKSIADNLCKKIGYSGGSFSDKIPNIVKTPLNKNEYENFLEKSDYLDNYPVYGKKVNNVRKGLPTYIDGSNFWGIKYRLRPASEHGGFISKVPSGDHEGFFEVKHYGITRGTRVINGIRKFTAYTPSTDEFNKWSNLTYPTKNPLTKTCTISDYHYGINTGSEIEKKTTQNSWQACKLLCENKSTCKYFSYLTDTQGCHLFKDNKNIMGNHYKIISGPGNCNDIQNEKLYPYLIRSKSFLHDWGPVPASFSNKANTVRRDEYGSKYSADWGNSMGNSICKSLGFGADKLENNIIAGNKHMKYANTITSNRGSNYSRKAMTHITYTTNNSDNTYKYGDLKWRGGSAPKHYYNMGSIYCNPSSVTKSEYYDTKYGLSGCKIWKNIGGEKYIPGQDDAEKNAGNTTSNDKAIWVECAGKKNKGVAEYGNKVFMKNVDDGLILENSSCSSDKTSKGCTFSNAPWIAGGSKKIVNNVEKDNKKLSTNPSRTTCDNKDALFIKCHGSTFQNNTTICRGNKGETCNVICKNNHPYSTPTNPPPKELFTHNNYCRNPEGGGSRPWCYTNHPNIRWALCDGVTGGKGYRGKVNEWIAWDHSADKTRKGKCAPWIYNKVHGHGYQGMGKAAVKRRRDYGMDTYKKTSLYKNFTCKFRNGKYEWIDENENMSGQCKSTPIKNLGGDGTQFCILTKKGYSSSDPEINPMAPYTTECYKGTGNEYVGDISISNTHKKCVPWNDKNIDPKEKKKWELTSNKIEWKSFRHDSFGSVNDGKAPTHNMCRTLNDKKPWCFIKKEDCYNPYNSVDGSGGEQYYGDIDTVLKTIDGVKYRGKCLDWRKPPLQHIDGNKIGGGGGYTKTSQSFRDMMLMNGNKCRVTNLKEEKGKPWCYFNNDTIQKYVGGKWVHVKNVKASNIDAKYNIYDLNESEKTIRWWYCDIPKCDNVGVKKESCDLQINKCERMPDHNWNDWSSEYCYKKNDGKYYNFKTKTVSGKTCLNWNAGFRYLSDSKGRENWSAADSFKYLKNNGQEKHHNSNKCLSMGSSDEQAWCYTAASDIRWERCEEEPCSLKRNKCSNNFVSSGERCELETCDKSYTFSESRERRAMYECKDGNMKPVTDDTKRCNPIKCGVSSDEKDDTKRNYKIQVVNEEKCFTKLGRRNWGTNEMGYSLFNKDKIISCNGIIRYGDEANNKWTPWKNISVNQNDKKTCSHQDGSPASGQKGIFKTEGSPSSGTKKCECREIHPKTDTYRQCQKVCQDTDDCRSFTWIKKNNNCHLFSEVRYATHLGENNKCQRTTYDSNIYTYNSFWKAYIEGIAEKISIYKRYSFTQLKEMAKEYAPNYPKELPPSKIPQEDTAENKLKLMRSMAHYIIHYGLGGIDLRGAGGKAIGNKKGSYRWSTDKNNYGLDIFNAVGGTETDSSRQAWNTTDNKNGLKITRTPAQLASLYINAVNAALENLEVGPSEAADAAINAYIKALVIIIKVKWRGWTRGGLRKTGTCSTPCKYSLRDPRAKKAAVELLGGPASRRVKGEPPHCEWTEGGKKYWEYCPPTDINGPMPCIEGDSETWSGPKYCPNKPSINILTKAPPISTGNIVSANIQCGTGTASKIQPNISMGSCDSTNTSTEKNFELKNCYRDCQPLKKADSNDNDTIIKNCDSHKHGEACKILCNNNKKINNKSEEIFYCNNGHWRYGSMRGIKSGEKHTCAFKTCKNGAYFDNIQDIKAIDPNDAIQVTKTKNGTTTEVDLENNQKVTFKSYKEDGYTKWPIIRGKIMPVKDKGKYNYGPQGSALNFTCAEGYQLKETDKQGKHTSYLINSDGGPYDEIYRKGNVYCDGNIDSGVNTGLTSGNCTPAKCRNIKKRENMEISPKEDDFVVCGKPKQSEFTYGEKKMFHNTPTIHKYGDNYAQTFDNSSNSKKHYYYYYYPRMGGLKQNTEEDNGGKYLPLNGRKAGEAGYDFEFRLRPKSEYHTSWYGKDTSGNVLKPDDKSEGHLEYRIKGDPVTRVKSIIFDPDDADANADGEVTEYRIKKSGWRPVSWSSGQSKHSKKDVMKTFCNILGYGNANVTKSTYPEEEKNKNKKKTIKNKYSWGDKKIGPGPTLNLNVWLKSGDNKGKEGEPDIRSTLGGGPLDTPFAGELPPHYKDNSIWLKCEGNSNKTIKKEKYCEYPSTLLKTGDNEYQCVTLKDKCKIKGSTKYTGKVNMDMCNDNGYIWYPEPKAGLNSEFKADGPFVWKKGNNNEACTTVCGADPKTLCFDGDWGINSKEDLLQTGTLLSAAQKEKIKDRDGSYKSIYSPSIVGTDVFWKAANVNGKIIPNKCSLKEQGVQRLCKCVKPTPAHCSTKGYLKHKSECKNCECKPGYNKLWVPFSITGTISVEIKTQKWKLISANDNLKSAGDTTDGLTIYNEGRASYRLPWTNKGDISVPVGEKTTKILSETKKWFEVYWNISLRRWEVSINTKGDSETTKEAINVVLFTNTDLTTRANQHLPPKDGWTKTKINGKDNTTMNFNYGKSDITCNLGLFEMRCVPTVCLRPEMKAYTVDFKNSIPKTFNINTIPLLSRKFNKKNICNPGYKFTDIKSVTNRITACTKSFEPIKINENICMQVKCPKLNADTYITNDPCAKSDTNHGTQCKVSCKDKVLDYKWDTSNKACMLGGKLIKRINNSLATPTKCKKTTIKKYWADNSGKYKDFTCGGISEGTSNLKSGDKEIGISGNSCSEKTCIRKGDTGGHIIKDTIPFTPSGIIKKIQGVPVSWALKTVPVKPTNANCNGGSRKWYDNKCFQASAKIEKNNCNGKDNKGQDLIWNSKMDAHDINLSNIKKADCNGDGKTWTDSKCIAKSYCYTKIDTFPQTPNKENCKGDTMFWQKTGNAEYKCFPSVSYRFSPSISTEINEKRPIKARIGQTLSPWFSQKEQGKEYNCDLSSNDDKLTCKGRTMIKEDDAPECYNVSTNGEDYRGKQNTVYHIDGKPPTPCLNWSTHNDAKYNSIDGNYCRNPGGLKNNKIKEPWCITASDEKILTTAVCNINKCTYKPVQKKGIIEMKYNVGPDTTWKSVCSNQISAEKRNNLAQAICMDIGYSGAKELPEKNSGKRWRGITDAERYYQLKELFMIEGSEEFWPGYTKNIYIPEDAKWGIRIRLSPTATGGGAAAEFKGNTNLVFKSDIEIKLYGIAKENATSKSLIAYTEDLQEYNYWKNVRYKQGSKKNGNDVSGKLIYENLVWKKDKSIWNKLSQTINSDILSGVGTKMCKNLGFKGGSTSIEAVNETYGGTPIIIPPMTGNQNDPTKIIIRTNPEIRMANGYTWDSNGNKCMRKEEIKKIDGVNATDKNCKQMNYTWDNSGKTCFLNEQITKINKKNASANNCKTTKHYKLSCDNKNVALNYFNKNGGPECPTSSNNTSINRCDFSLKDKNACTTLNNGMFVECNGIDTLYDATNESTICSGGDKGQCFFNCKDKYKTMINGKEVQNRKYVTCVNDAFENGYCEGEQCNMPRNSIKNGIFDGACQRNIKGNVPHKTECSLSCDNKSYLSNQNNLFRCNHGVLSNNNNTRCLPQVCKDPTSISKEYTPIDKKSKDYQLNKVKGFKIPIKCAENYKGSAVATPCENHDEPWTVSGCSKIECNSRRKTDDIISKMNEDIKNQENENNQQMKVILFKLGLNDHKLNEQMTKKNNAIKSIVSKHNCRRNESSFNKNKGDHLYPWNSDLPENFDIDLLKVECDMNTYKGFKGDPLSIKRKKLRQKVIDEGKVLSLFKDVKKHESDMNELIKITMKTTKNIKLKQKYNELTKTLSSKKEDMYTQSDGYTIYNETDLHISNLKVNVRCAKYYRGSVKVETCKRGQTPYTLTGCSPDPKHPHNCIDKCKKEDIDNGTCKSSMIDKKHGDTVGDCKGILVQGKTCTPTCKPGYFLEMNTKCGMKDNKGFIIPATCKLFVKNDKTPDKPRIRPSTDFTNKEYQDKRTTIMKKYNNDAYQKSNQS